MNDYDTILAKSPENGVGIPLRKHIEDVASVAVVIAENLNLDTGIARKGALLHDIGKASPLFQQKFKQDYIMKPGFVFRHEIASLFFISLLDSEEEKKIVVEMIAAHHKSMYGDVRELGILDLDESENSFKIHSEDFGAWCPAALEILSESGMMTHPITLDEAKKNYDYAVSYCESLRDTNTYGYSIWKGVLMAADHFASALGEKSSDEVSRLFVAPDLSYYDRKSELYPLSLIAEDDARRHTLVTAPTGAGKTDFLLRRCKGRVFYTLPFQASINAMYDRIGSDLKNTDAQICLLHATSSLKVKDKRLEERMLQRHVGASVKILTPYQMASIAFGIKGYEAMISDLKGCDVVLDEIHTYSDVMQSIVLKIIEILLTLDCRIHVGTATMPTALYKKILAILGNNTYEIKLPENILKTFDRHIIHKMISFEQCYPILDRAVEKRDKILIVCNRVKRAQELYRSLKEIYPEVDMMLIHSRFKREHRQTKETELKNIYNISGHACIVVSTQVVEVSLDISFDMMITECAPIDAMIQRFGRINRKRPQDPAGKHIYVTAPPDDEKEARPYSLDVLKRSYEVLPDDNWLHEADVQKMLDTVYPEITTGNLDYSGAIFKEGQWSITQLCHKAKSALLETLDIDTAVCITEEDDKKRYKFATETERLAMEIPVNYRFIAYKGLDQRDYGMRPYIIPDKAYSEELGLLQDEVCLENFVKFEIM